MIGRVGTIFGEEGVNIVSAAVGAEPEGDTAVMALTTDAPVNPATIDRILELDGFFVGRAVSVGLMRVPRRRSRGATRLMMRAVVQTGHGGPEVLQVQERPDPPVGPGEVRIDVKAAGINFADTMARVGLYPDAPKPPCVLGYEVAGEVESVGAGVEAVSAGDRVIAGTRFGGHASMISVPEDQVFPLPDGWSFEQGAAFPVNYTTSYVALVMMGGIRKGDRVLIHAAAGGVGISATQIARSRETEIFGTASASKHDAIREQGVDHPIDYRTLDFEQEVRRITGGEGVDVIMDATGPTNFRKDYRLLRQGGKLIMYGASELSTGKGRSVRAVARGPC